MGLLPAQRDQRTPRKRYRPEEIAGELRQVEIVQVQRKTVAAYTIREVGVSVVAYYRGCKEYAGMSAAQLKRLKELAGEYRWLRRALSDLTLDELIPQEAARRNFRAIRASGFASTHCCRS